MNFDDSENEEGASEPVMVDQVRHNLQKASIESEMAARYGGVAVIGFQKKIDMNKVLDVLKEAGLPFDYAKEDLQTVEKGEYITISVRELKPQTCVEIINNLDGEEKLGRRVSVFALVGGTPIKQSEIDLEEVTKKDTEEKSEVQVKQTPDITSPASSSSLLGNIVSKLWYNDPVVNDLHITDDSDEDEEKTTNKENFFKRKHEVRSPESEFEKVSRKDNNKKRRSRNKSN